MASTFSASGLISGLDSATIIKQLMQIERQPVTRMESKVASLEKQRTAVRELRTQLLSLRTSVQNFRFGMVFNQFKAASSKSEVLTASASTNPVQGSYTVNVTQLASATIAKSSGTLGGSIDASAALNEAGFASNITGTKFSINGVQFTIDPDTQSLDDVLAMINAGGAGVTATYDSGSDRVTFVNDTPGDTSLINFGGSDDDSNFLDMLAVTRATQSTNLTGTTEVLSTRNLGAVSPSVALDTVNFSRGAVTAGTFSINGVTFTVDPTKDSLSDILGRINGSSAQVTASYDSATDTLRFVSKVSGSRTIRFAAGTSNFLDVTNLTSATQTAGKDARFKINDGPEQTRNSNEVADAIGGVTLTLLSEGTSTVTVSSDDDAILKDVQKFIDDFNASVTKIQDLVKKGGTAENDGSLRLIESFLRSTIFSKVESAGGARKSLIELGISTGDSFDSEAVSKLKLDADKFKEALRESRYDVEGLFANRANDGIADQFFKYLDGITSTSGFLNDRVKSNGTIDQQIQAYNSRIEMLERRLTLRQARLEKQFLNVETMSSTYQRQSSALSGLSNKLLRF